MKIEIPPALHLRTTSSNRWTLTISPTLHPWVYPPLYVWPQRRSVVPGYLYCTVPRISRSLHLETIPVVHPWGRRPPRSCTLLLVVLHRWCWCFPISYNKIIIFNILKINGILSELWKYGIRIMSWWLGITKKNTIALRNKGWIGKFWFLKNFVFFTIFLYEIWPTGRCI